MPDSEQNSRNSTVPEPFRLIPIHPDYNDSSVRIGVLARREPIEKGEALILLRQTVFMKVYLGAVYDRGGRVWDWVEVWVQWVDSLDHPLLRARQLWTNGVLDDRWRADFEGAKRLLSTEILETGWEVRAMIPVWLHSEEERACYYEEEGHPWEVCRDEGLLQRAGLPGYGAGFYRYAYRPDRGDDSGFVPLVEGAPENAVTRTKQQVFSGLKHEILFNPQGGLIQIRRLAECSLVEYLDLLGGKPWEGIPNGKEPIGLSRDWEIFKGDTGSEHFRFFLGAYGKNGRFLEAYHLKLQIFTEMLQEVQAWIRNNQVPFLNLDLDSFRVKLQESGRGLPGLWNSKLVLSKVGQGVALPIPTSEERYFIRMGEADSRVFLPQGIGVSQRGGAQVCMRKLLPPDGKRVVLEGTLVVTEPLRLSRHDLLWIQIPTSLEGGPRLDLYAQAGGGEGGGEAGEIRFRTLAQELPDGMVGWLEKNLGGWFPRSVYEVIPMLSSPCDLFSLGILGIRTFLVDERVTFAEAIDECFSFARRLIRGDASEETQGMDGLSLGGRVEALVRGDKRWLGYLGPHRLTLDKMEPDDALGILPGGLWWDTVVGLLRLFPGLMGRESYCSDYSDVSSLALESVLEEPIQVFQGLLERSRSLIVIDWKYNQEIRQVIQDFLKGNQEAAGSTVGGARYQPTPNKIR